VKSNCQKPKNPNQRKKTRPKSRKEKFEVWHTGYNWRASLSDYARVSGVLAGFSITFIALILGGKVADFSIWNGVSFGQVSVLLFGAATSLLIASSQLFLQAREFDVFSIPERYIKLLKEDCELKNKKWADYEDEQTKHCRIKEQMGRKFYNAAIFLMFVGLFFAILPYNTLIAIVVGGLGLALEVWQYVSRT
jgi:hypothetical protein